MISLHMQGGCLCENPPGAAPRHDQRGDRGDDRAAAAADGFGDRRLDGQHAGAEYPAVRRIYRCWMRPIASQAVRFQAEHNYNQDSREAMYAWMARWMQHTPADRQVRSARSLPTPLPTCSSSISAAFPTTP